MSDLDKPNNWREPVELLQEWWEWWLLDENTPTKLPDALHMKTLTFLLSRYHETGNEKGTKRIKDLVNRDTVLMDTKLEVVKETD